MTMKLTDEQVVRVLAERMGMVPMTNFALDGGYWDPKAKCTHLVPNSPLHEKRKEMGLTSRAPFLLGDWLHSRDALAPVLAGLSEMEWHQLGWKLYPLVSSAHTGWFTSSEATVRFTVRFALTLPPADLARAIAEAISK